MTSRPRRRDNAPIRPRRPATTVPDLLFAVAAMAWAMGGTLAVAALIDVEVVSGEAGRALALFFAAALAIAGLMVFLLGVVLLRDERNRVDHYRLPLLLGGAIGVVEGLLFLFPAGTLVFLPFVFLVFALRPVRRALGLMGSRKR